MKRILLLISFVCALLGCSTNELPEEPTYLEIGGYLSGYFSNLDGSGDKYGQINCDTLYNGTQYLINLHPYALYAKNGIENDGIIKSIIYYINGNAFANVSTFPFTTYYTPNLQPGKYTISVKPTFSSEYIIWETKESNVMVLNGMFE